MKINPFHLIATFYINLLLLALCTYLLIFGIDITGIYVTLCHAVIPIFWSDPK